MQSFQTFDHGLKNDALTVDVYNNQDNSVSVNPSPFLSVAKNLDANSSNEQKNDRPKKVIA